VWWKERPELGNPKPGRLLPEEKIPQWEVEPLRLRKEKMAGLCRSRRIITSHVSFERRSSRLSVAEEACYLARQG
jgi:hypothetical protein